MCFLTSTWLFPAMTIWVSFYGFRYRLSIESTGCVVTGRFVSTMTVDAYLLTETCTCSWTTTTRYVYSSKSLLTYPSHYYWQTNYSTTLLSYCPHSWTYPANLACLFVKPIYSSLTYSQSAHSTISSASSLCTHSP